MLTEEQIYSFLDDQEDNSQKIIFLEQLYTDILQLQEHWTILLNYLFNQILAGDKQVGQLSFKILRILIKSNSSEVNNFVTGMIKQNIENLGSQDVISLNQAGIRKNGHNLNQFIIKLQGSFDQVLEYYRSHGILNQDVIFVFSFQQNKKVLTPYKVQSLTTMVILRKIIKKYHQQFKNSQFVVRILKQPSKKQQNKLCFLFKNSSQWLNSTLRNNNLTKFKISNRANPKKPRNQKLPNTQNKTQKFKIKMKYGFKKSYITLKKINLTRQQAIEELEQFTEIQKSKLYITKTLDIVIELLDDPNFKICVTSTNIILKITNQSVNYEKLNNLIDKIFQKLGDSKMAMRSQSQRIIKNLFENQNKIKQEYWLERCIDELQNASLIHKETILNLILFFQQQIEYDSQFEKLIKTIAVGYRDQKEKIKTQLNQILINLSQKLQQIELKDLVTENFDDPNEILSILKIPLNPIFPTLNPNRTITSEISQNLHSRSSQRFPSEDHTPKRFMSPNFITTDSYKIFESQKLDQRNSQYDSTQISIGSRSLIKQQENSTDNNFRISSAQNNEYQSIIDKKNQSVFSVQEGQLVGFSFQKALEDFQSSDTSFKDKSPIVSTQSFQSQQSYSQSLNNIPASPIENTIYKPPIQKKSNKKFVDTEKENNLVIESKEHHQKKILLSKKTQGIYFNLDIECIQEKEEQEDDNIQNQENKFSRDINVKYINFEDLKPLQKPQSDMKQMLKDIKSDDWLIVFNTLNTFRRFIKNHSELILPDILNHVDNLRSGVSKNALLTVQEITYYGKLIESYLDKIFVKIFKKGQDANEFIQSQVKKAMQNICEKCCSSKVLQFLSTRASGIRCYQGKLILLIGLDTVFNQNKLKFLQMKDSDKLIYMNCNYLFDGNQEVRKYSQNLFLQIRTNFMNQQDFNYLLQKSLNESLYTQVQNYLKNQGLSQEQTHFIIKNQTKIYQKQNQDIAISTQKFGENDLQFTQTKDEASTLYKRKSTTMKLKEPSDFEDLPTIFSQIESQVRFTTIKQLQNCAEKHSVFLLHSKSFQKYLDYFLKLIADQNLKIQTQSLQSFQQIIPYIKVELLIQTGIESNISQVNNTVFNCFGSSNPQVKMLADDVLDSIQKTVQNQSLFNSLLHGIQYANLKARSGVITKATQYLQSSSVIESFQNNFLQKNFLSVIIKLCDDKQTDIRQASVKCLQQISSSLGKGQILNLVPENKHSFL